MNKIRIHIYCLRQEICSLIKKALSPAAYNVTCSKDEDEFTGIFKEQIDCLILDKDIDEKLIESIKKKFEGISIISLPSLVSENNIEPGVKIMSEPLKLSELSDHINNIFQNRVT